MSPHKQTAGTNAGARSALKCLASTALVWSIGVGTALAQSPASAPGQVQVAEVIAFEPGTPKARASLAKIAAVRDLVAEAFVYAGVDLNDDGRKEMLVLARSGSFCGSGGCMLVVLEQQGPKVVTLATLQTDGALGVTQHKVGAYRALAALDDKGAVAIADKPGAPLHGKPMVYAIGPQPQEPAARGAAATAAPAPAPAAKAAPVAAAAGPSIDVLGLRLGMSIAQVRDVLRRMNPPAIEQEQQLQSVHGLTGPPRQPSLLVTVQAIGSFHLAFAPPPGPDRLLYVRRSQDFGDHLHKGAARIGTENLEHALRQKYGEPHESRSGGPGITLLNWAWSPRGDKLAPAEVKGCVNSTHEASPAALWNPYSPQSGRRPPFDARCGVIIAVTIVQQAGVVSRMDLIATDASGALAARTALAQALDRAAAQQDKKALDDARKNKPAI
jgi:hypothetical protein